jgi:hypothetical protein
VAPLLRLGGLVLAGEYVPVRDDAIGSELARFGSFYGLEARHTP